MSDEFELLTVELPVEKNLAKLDYMDEAAKNYDGMMWYEPVMVTKGGAAGKGPEPPEPPAMHVDGSSEYPHMTEELETHESEGKTKMAFAKMQVPQGLKESSLLQDADFVLKKTSEKETTETLEDGSDSEEKGTENQEKVEDAKEVHPKDEASVASIEKPNSRESVYDQEPEDLSPQSSVRSMGKPRKSVRTNKSKETGTMSDQAARLGLYN